MILHFFLNTLLVFFVLTLLVDFFIFAFRVKNSRVRCLCRTLPIIKLPIDMVIYGIFGFADSFFINLNPFSCEVYLQKLIFSILPVNLQHELSDLERIIIPQYISSQIPAIWLKICITLFLMTSCLLVFRKFYKILYSKINMQNIFNLSSHSMRKVSNLKLKDELIKLNIIILTSTQVQIPLAAFHRYILIPKNLEETFSQEEFDAVIAHELEHLRWKDPILKLSFNAISTLFWWIPTTWWLKKLEVEQEEASDAGLQRYDIDPLSLAEALIKVINQTKHIKLKYNLCPVCGLNSSKSSHLKRFENLLNSDQTHKNNIYQIWEFAGPVACLLASISFWMC